MIQTQRQQNPAKLFLQRYRALIARQESLQRSIDAAYSRATSCTSRLKPVTVTGGNGAFDRMAEDVTRITDETAQLRAVLSETGDALREILSAIESVPDEMQKTVLTMRYVEGMYWHQIISVLHYESTQVFILHGRALQAVKKWMETAE